MEILEAIKGRRSIRKFKGKMPKDSLIASVIDAAQWAPSACNKQLWEFIVVKDQETKNKLVDIAKAVPFLRNAPVAIYVTYPSEVNSVNDANIQSVSAAVQNMLLMAHAKGLGAVWVSACGNRKKAKQILSVPSNYLIVCAVLLGYSDEKPNPPARRAINELIHENRFNGKKIKFEFGKLESVDKLMDFRARGIRATSQAVDISHALGSISKAAAKNELEIALRKISKDDAVLDVLGYAGVYTLELLRHLKQIYTYETCDDIISFITNRKKTLSIKGDLNIKKSSLNKIPYNDSFFSQVTCFQKINLNPKPTELLHEINRVLKKNGRLVLSFVNSSSSYGVAYLYYTKVLGNTYIINEGPMIPMTLGKVKNLLAKSGFRIEKITGLGFLPERLGGKLLARIKTKMFARISPFIVIEAVK